jgi:hypothetical protein
MPHAQQEAWALGSCSSASPGFWGNTEAAASNMGAELRNPGQLIMCDGLCCATSMGAELLGVGSSCV